MAISSVSSLSPSSFSTTYFLSPLKTQDHPLLAALVYSITMNSKHLFCFQAPIFLIFLLRTYCVDSSRRFSFRHFFQLAAIVLSSTPFSPLPTSFFPLPIPRPPRGCCRQSSPVPLPPLPLPAGNYPFLLGAQPLGPLRGNRPGSGGSSSRPLPTSRGFLPRPRPSLQHRRRTCRNRDLFRPPGSALVADDRADAGELHRGLRGKGEK